MPVALSEGVVRNLLGGGPDDVPERYAAASPVALLPSGVPHLLVHGAEDGIVPIEISKRYHDAATAHGDDVTLLALAGAGHFELIDPASTLWPEILTAIKALAG